MNSAIILDFKPNKEWKFLKDLEEKTKNNYECIYEDTHNWHGSKKILRYISYVFLPLKILFNKKHYDEIIAWQQFYGLFYAFWSRLCRKEKTAYLVVLTYIYKPKKGIVGKVYDRIMRFIVESGYIDRYVCFSEKECDTYSEYFGIERSKFVACKLQVDDSYGKYGNAIEEEYYLSAGRSNRDYNFLCDVFKKLPDKKLVIVCDVAITDEFSPPEYQVAQKLLWGGIFGITFQM